MIDLDISTLMWPRPDLSGCATGNKNYPKICREDKLEVKINGKVQGAYKLSDYFSKPDDRCILCNEVVHTTFGSTSQEDHDVQITVGTHIVPTQIPGHTNYSRSVRQPFSSSTGLRFTREMAVVTIGPFQILRSLCVIGTNFTILRHFLLKLWRNEILR
jgi:hypothetical protein